MSAFFGFVEIEECAASDNHLAMLEIKLQSPLKCQHARLLVYQCQQLNCEGRLERRKFVELVQYFFGLRAALQFNHDTHAITV